MSHPCTKLVCSLGIRGTPSTSSSHTYTYFDMCVCEKHHFPLYISIKVHVTMESEITLDYCVTNAIENVMLVSQYMNNTLVKLMGHMRFIRMKTIQDDIVLKITELQSMIQSNFFTKFVSHVMFTMQSCQMLVDKIKSCMEEVNEKDDFLTCIQLVDEILDELHDVINLCINNDADHYILNNNNDLPYKYTPKEKTTTHKDGNMNIYQSRLWALGKYRHLGVYENYHLASFARLLFCCLLNEHQIPNKIHNNEDISKYKNLVM